jgi:hypothetical protein
MWRGFSFNQLRLCLVQSPVTVWSVACHALLMLRCGVLRHSLWISWICWVRAWWLRREHKFPTSSLWPVWSPLLGHCSHVTHYWGFLVARFRGVAIEGSFPPDTNKVTKIRESECCCHKLAVLFILQLDYRRFPLQETSLRWTAFIWCR